jgi:serine phosphatase RsbU (regulator of sigma subunit)
MEVQIAIAKVNKYASAQSGDTAEIIERPNGGLSVILADGQSSGRGAKAVSILVVRKVLGLLAEGVRDGAAARAASDSLYTERKGRVSSTLNIFSIDLQTNTLVITRNNPAPVLVVRQGQLQALDEESSPIGLYRDTRPVICELPLEVGLTAVMFTDGLVHAGSRRGAQLDLPKLLSSLLANAEPSAQAIADALLAAAVELDEDRPVDDASVAVLRVSSHSGDSTRRMSVRLPLVSRS